MVQNHLFQILSIVAMEWPEQFSTTAMHDAQLRVLRALRPVEDVRDSLVLGQYKGYRQEKSVPTDSTTETYAAEGRLYQSGAVPGDEAYSSEP